MKTFATLIISLLAGAVIAQAEAAEDSAAFKLGIYVGYYNSGDATANYYNGRDNNRLEYFLKQPYTHTQIKESLGGYEFSLEEYANDMRYNAAASFELQMAYEFGRNWSISARFHNVSLAAAGIFTLRVQRQNQNNSVEPYLEQADISGKETRSHIDFGVGKKFFFEEKFYFLAEAGLDLNFVEVKENKLRIADRTYGLSTYTNVLNQQASNPTTFGSGFYLGPGLGYAFPGNMDFLVKATYMRTKININKVFKAQTNIFIPSVGFSMRF